MIFGLSTETYTLLHVLISFAGMATGLAVVAGFLQRRRYGRWNAAFLVTTAATSLTGFGFPFDHLLPSHKVGILSFVILALAAFARYGRGLAGRWASVYAVCAVAAFYLNVFVGVVQAFLKVPALKASAPTQTEPPFAIAQLAVLAIFAGIALAAWRKSRLTAA